MIFNLSVPSPMNLIMGFHNQIETPGLFLPVVVFKSSKNKFTCINIDYNIKTLRWRLATFENETGLLNVCVNQQPTGGKSLRQAEILKR